MDRQAILNDLKKEYGSFPNLQEQEHVMSNKELFKVIFSDEEGNFQVINLIGTICLALLFPMLHIFLYALGCR